MSELKHNCEGNCSGWDDGKLKGLSETEEHWQQKITPLVEALEFYADMKQWTGAFVGSLGDRTEFIAGEGGEKARQALKEWEGE